MTQATRINTPSERIIKSNAPLLLDTPNFLWGIKSGAMAVFAVSTLDGAPQGSRRFLFEVKQGDTLFCLDKAAKGLSHELIAVAYEETHLIGYTLDDWLCRAKAAGQALPKFASAPAQWSDRLTAIFKTTPLTIPPLAALTSASLPSFATSVQQFHANVLAGLDQLNQSEIGARVNQFEKRLQLNRQSSERAIEELTAVFRPQEAQFFQDGVPLVVAAGAVGKALGIQIRPPGRSEDMKRVKDPLDAIARASRIRTRRVILAGAWWQSDCGPLLAYTVDGENPVALLPKGSGQYEIFDPVQRQRLPLTAAIAQQLSPIAYMFYRSFAERALKSADIFKFIIHGQIRDLVIILLMGLAGTLLGMVVPQATGILIDQAIPNANQSLLLQIALGLLAVTFGKTIFDFVSGTAMTRIQSHMNAHTQAAVWDRLLKLRVSFFRQYSTGDLQSRVSAINQIRQILSGSVLRSLLSGFFALFNLGLLFFYSAQMALVALAIAAVNLTFTAVFAVISRKKMMAQASSVGARLGLEVQLIDGISKLRVAGAEERAFAFWTKRYRQQTNYTMSTSAIQDGVMLFNTTMSATSSILIYALAVFLMAAPQTTGANPAMAATAGISGLSIGTFLAFNAAFGTFMSGATSLSNTIIDIMDISIMWKRAQPILKELPEVDRGKADPGRLQGGVRLDRVSFRYRKDGPLTLDRISIEAKPGESIALVGPSGSGKSTVVRLLLGFEKPEDGTIYYDGQDLAGLDVLAVRRQLGVVLQNGRLNSASLFENISAGALITMDEAWEAARLAGFADDIEQMPMGMHTVVSEGGTNLSGGQRQRLLITRALVLKPKVLIFDEATSALDNRTQAIVSESLDRLDVTRVIIAHRLSTIRKVDRIYVVSAGQIIQQGSFDQLMQQKGVFVDLMARQVA